MTGPAFPSSTVTRSPIPSIARPRMSKPGSTLPTDPGAKTVARLIARLGVAQAIPPARAGKIARATQRVRRSSPSLLNSDRQNVIEDAGGRDIRTRTRTGDDQWIRFVSLRVKRNLIGSAAERG